MQNKYWANEQWNGLSPTLDANGKIPINQLPNINPVAHKSSHSIGGSDPLTPADIGAAPSNIFTHDIAPEYLGQINEMDVINVVDGKIVKDIRAVELCEGAATLYSTAYWSPYRVTRVINNSQIVGFEYDHLGTFQSQLALFEKASQTSNFTFTKTGGVNIDISSGGGAIVPIQETANNKKALLVSEGASIMPIVLGPGSITQGSKYPWNKPAEASSSILYSTACMLTPTLGVMCACDFGGNEPYYNGFAQPFTFTDSNNLINFSTSSVKFSAGSLQGQYRVERIDDSHALVVFGHYAKSSPDNTYGCILTVGSNSITASSKYTIFAGKRNSVFLHEVAPNQFCVVVDNSYALISANSNSISIITSGTVPFGAQGASCCAIDKTHMLLCEYSGRKKCALTVDGSAVTFSTPLTGQLQTLNPSRSAMTSEGYGIVNGDGGSSDDKKQYYYPVKATFGGDLSKEAVVSSVNSETCDILYCGAVRNAGISKGQEIRTDGITGFAPEAGVMYLKGYWEEEV